MIRAAICAAALIGVAAAESPEKFFDRRVAPILIGHCLGCHNDELNDGGISFLDRATLLKGGSHGPAVAPGKPEASVLIHAIRQDGDLRMPPGPKLPAKDIAILTEWVRRGAVWGSKLR